ncbi:MAG: UvrD-helicase domain-containing protein [Candidatus Nanohaloarchaea archaeon]
MAESPNLEQEEIIETIDGPLKVDAGPGTGKTFAVTRRYVNILEQEGVDPGDILLLTFTRNAAEEMKERIMDRSGRDQKQLQDAPISTFHSLARGLLIDHGHQAPRLLGIDASITRATRVIEDPVLKDQEFSEFYRDFRTDNQEYRDFYTVVEEEGYEAELLHLIDRLASRGIVPASDGWYRDSRDKLEGDREKLLEEARHQNRKQGATPGSAMSDLLSTLELDELLLEDGMDRDTISNDTKQVKEKHLVESFDQDRERLFDFFHDLYLAYIRHCLSRDHLTHSLSVVLAYVLLVEDDELREQLRYDYAMIDEFQDTSRVQMELALLLSSRNLCVVGDWKQSIYRFQGAEVENITGFRERLKEISGELNRDTERVKVDSSAVQEVTLRTNYRSTQPIIEFSGSSLGLEAHGDEDIDEDDYSITELEADRDDHGTRVHAIESGEEKKAVLAKIQELVEEGAEVEVDGEKRPVEHGDFAVLSRDKKFTRELEQEAERYGIPAGFEGEKKIFNRDSARLLLAWLRILQDRHSRKGWIPVLEHAGYSFPEIRQRLDAGDYPANMLEFRDSLGAMDDVAGVAAGVFDRYGFKGNEESKMLEVLQEAFDTSYRNTGELVNFINESIHREATHRVDKELGPESVTLQTLHSAKGLEYPVVFISNINYRNFPNFRGDSGTFTYDRIRGLRQSSYYSPEKGWVLDDWRTHVLSEVDLRDFDEERRLMYVGMTRARDHLYFTRDAEGYYKSRFSRQLPLDFEQYDREPHQEEPGSDARQLEVEDTGERPPVLRPVHALLDLEEDGEGPGKEYGEQVHRFAERYARGEDVEPRNEDEENVKQFIDSLDGELRPEIPVLYPDEDGGRKVVYRGKADLLHIDEDEAQVIDYKTARDHTNEEEYQKQLDIYRKAAAHQHDLPVTARILWTGED